MGCYQLNVKDVNHSNSDFFFVKNYSFIYTSIVYKIIIFYYSF